jgi:O-antigen ligase
VASAYGMTRLFWGINLLNIKFSDAHRNTGFFGMVLNYAHNLAFVTVLLATFIIKKEYAKKYFNFSALIAFFLICVTALYYTYSRGAFLAFLAAVPFIFFKKNIKTFIIFGIFSFIVLILFNTVPALKVVRGGSDLERLSQWKTALKGFEERPILGQGYLNFEHRCPELKIKYDIDQKQFCGHAHSSFLEILASTGGIGFTFFILWLISWFIEMVKRKDIVGDITIPLIIVFIVGSLTQATFTLGANLFLILGIYTISMVNLGKLKYETSNL